MATLSQLFYSRPNIIVTSRILPESPPSQYASDMEAGSSSHKSRIERYLGITLLNKMEEASERVPVPAIRFASDCVDWFHAGGNIDLTQTARILPPSPPDTPETPIGLPTGKSTLSVSQELSAESAGGPSTETAPNIIHEDPLPPTTNAQPLRATATSFEPVPAMATTIPAEPTPFLNAAAAPFQPNSGMDSSSDLVPTDYFWETAAAFQPNSGMDSSLDLEPTDYFWETAAPLETSFSFAPAALPKVNNADLLLPGGLYEVDNMAPNLCGAFNTTESITFHIFNGNLKIRNVDANTPQGTYKLTISMPRTNKTREQLEADVDRQTEGLMAQVAKYGEKPPPYLVKVIESRNKIVTVYCDGDLEYDYGDAEFAIREETGLSQVVDRNQVHFKVYGGSIDPQQWGVFTGPPPR